jgi:membrane protease YdiL (CAAX protease family)
MQKNDNFPSGFQAFLLVVALFLCEVLVGALLGDMQGMLQLALPELAALVVLLGNGLIFIFVMHFKGLSYRDLFHPSPGSAKATFFLLVPPVLMLIPALILAMSVLQDLLVRIAPLSAWEEARFNQMMSGGPGALVVVCLLAPVLEEMLFRGVILRSFLVQYPRWQAILGSALLFGFAHLNTYQFALGLLMGTLLGWLYERTRSLIPCIALHAAYNSGVMVLGWAADGQPPDILQATAASSWFVSLALAGVGVFSLHRMLGGRRAAA